MIFFKNPSPLVSFCLQSAYLFNCCCPSNSPTITDLSFKLLSLVKWKDTELLELFCTPQWETCYIFEDKSGVVQTPEFLHSDTPEPDIHQTLLPLCIIFLRLKLLITMWLFAF